MAPLAPLERGLRRRLSRGQAGVDAALDLHGMTQAVAHRALRAFLLDVQAESARVVLVVTGKGRSGRDDDTARRIGVLRQVVPLWLGAADMRALVLGFEEADDSHGGAGALYVRLRRRADPA